jgi:hypothetical protein
VRTFQTWREEEGEEEGEGEREEEGEGERYEDKEGDQAIDGDIFLMTLWPLCWTMS